MAKIKITFDAFDPIKRNAQKSSYNRSKKMKYLLGFVDHCQGKIPGIKSFTVFAKKG